jgi:hypothetical protein
MDKTDHSNRSIFTSGQKKVQLLKHCVLSGYYTMNRVQKFSNPQMHYFSDEDLIAYFAKQIRRNSSRNRIKIGIEMQHK